MEEKAEHDEKPATGCHGVLLLHKKVGGTPLQTIRSLQATIPSFNGLKIGYAGRLDPMARGLLVCLVGDENRNQKTHELKTKDYQFDVLFGVETDTYDLLGLVQRSFLFNHQLQDIIEEENWTREELANKQEEKEKEKEKEEEASIPHRSMKKRKLDQDQFNELLEDRVRKVIPLFVGKRQQVFLTTQQPILFLLLIFYFLFYLLKS